MPSRSLKKVKAPSKADNTIAAKAQRAAPKVKAQRIAATGLTNRIKGHVVARGARTQARRNKR
jgi:hypothetical protein